MLSLKNKIKQGLKKADKIAVLAIGSELRADDAAGELTAIALKKTLKNKKFLPKVKFFFGKTAPENFTGEIKKFKPSHIIILDAADLNKKPGTSELVSYSKIGGTSFSTHRMPAKIMADYLINSLSCKVIVIGIQPKSLEFGKPVSRPVQSAINKLAPIIQKAIISAKR